MSSPKNRTDLLTATESEFHALLDTVAAVPEHLRAIPGVCDDWSVKDLLAHLDAWHEMFLRWDAVGFAGGTPAMPTRDHTWDQVPVLNADIYEQHKNESWDQVVSRLEHSYDRIDEVIASYNNDDLFTEQRFPWTGTSSIASYATSVTFSHYVWAHKLIRGWLKDHPEPTVPHRPVAIPGDSHIRDPHG